jgi:hypothetical protein
MKAEPPVLEHLEVSRWTYEDQETILLIDWEISESIVAFPEGPGAVRRTRV